MTQEKTADARVRVYKYTGQDGVVYYSFTRRPKLISTSQTLTLESRIGTHLENFIPKFRAEGRRLRTDFQPGEEEES